MDGGIDDVRSFSSAGRTGLGPSSSVTVSTHGVVSVRRGSRTYAFDLYDRDTKVTLTGEPSARNWKATLSNHTESVSLDNKQVEAESFAAELQRWRPELAD
jgi:hypothetical protein